MSWFFTKSVDFYRQNRPDHLLTQYGSPLYAYNEQVLRERCRDMKNLVDSPLFGVNYSTKANSNLTLLNIIREEGLDADAMSPGEIHVLLQAGFKPEQIFYICNNVSVEEMAYAVERDICVSVDSLSQLELFGRAFAGRRVAVRINTGHGAGHNEKVVTAGKKTKFGVNDDQITDIKALVKRYSLRLCGLNQHVGSLFMEGSAYLAGARLLMELALEFDDLEFIDLGGGFGISYYKQAGEGPMDLAPLSRELTELIQNFQHRCGRPVHCKIEPGRYITAECGVLLGNVLARKVNSGVTYVGTDLGFNVLQRPIMYDAHHEAEIYRDGVCLEGDHETVTVVGNICESGDKLLKARSLPRMQLGDVIAVMDAGAYGYSMASNYNNRLRPAEVLIGLDGQPRLIRRRDTLEDLMRGFAL
ncbi:MAG: diaminopimelate decarboxylase [Clostridiales bacterium]|nr:diaminopimelate decarboxylase [Clostridiales bacterium]